ncbi:MAG: prephenate dehydrogenase [Clostridiaceae bacterium]|jgi:prephenate dehydrogenase|nr:prephenate dehydrogenase [Clostridiaceae bacterium]
MKKIGVIGLGIIGGSLVKAISKKGLSDCIVAYNRNPEITALAVKEGTVHKAAREIDESFEDCDIIFICVPVDVIPGIVYKLSGIVKKGCILTDVGSTKTDVMKVVENIEIPFMFIGGHPMAGSEETGYRHARHNLFENAYYILTPPKNTGKKYVENLAGFIESLGALPIILKPEEHDYAVAAISHVPHVLASSLVNTIRDLDDDKKLMHTLAAGGFRDITRIASSSPEIWKSICLTNKGNIILIIQKFMEKTEQYINALIKNDDKMLSSLFSDAKDYRDSFSEKRVGALFKTYDIIVDVEDKPGVIGTIAGEFGKRGISIKNIGINNSREMEKGAMEICFYDRESQINSLNILKSMGYTVSIR